MSNVRDRLEELKKEKGIKTDSDLLRLTPKPSYPKQKGPLAKWWKGKAAGSSTRISISL